MKYRKPAEVNIASKPENVMIKNDPAIFHRLYGAKRPRAVYYKRDFLDYLIMLLLTALVMILSYGWGPMSVLGLALCAFILAMFIVRHGIEFRVPLILRRPQDFLYMFIYKLQNLGPMYFAAVGLLLLENALIIATPNLPHHVELVRKLAVYLLYIHFLGITIFRTAILVDHLKKKELVREVLLQTSWKRAIKENTNITLEILHAYCTGILTHIVLLAPWYLVIRYSRFSIIFLPVVCLLNVRIYRRWVKDYNAWYYRDHWLGHNAELEFIFLHGTHHDAIPSALIAVAENGFLEGFTRFMIGSPNTFYNPLVTFAIYTMEVKLDIQLHQYIPGIYPQLPRRVLEIFQHSTHHYGPLEPYGTAMKLGQPGSSVEDKKAARLPEELRNSIKLDEDLTGFEWDNPTYRKILSLYDKYHM